MVRYIKKIIKLLINDWVHYYNMLKRKITYETRINYI